MDEDYTPDGIDTSYVYYAGGGTTTIQTCKDLWDHIKTHDVTVHDEDCIKYQADAAWTCGCPNFPPFNVSESTCRLCNDPINEIPTVIDLSIPRSVCEQGDLWAAITGNGLPSLECRGLRESRLGRTCECQPKQPLLLEGEKNDAPPLPLGDALLLGDDGCITNLDAIVTREARVTDTSIVREYVLCPNTSFYTGDINLEGGQSPLTVKSNCTLLCGVDGKSTNNCTIQDSDNGMAFRSQMWGYKQIDKKVEQIAVHGVTFRNMSCGGIDETCHQFASVVSIRTDIDLSFVDCIFEVKSFNV